MLSRLNALLGLIRFSHTVFALPFALVSAAIAWKDEPFRWVDLLGILMCMVFARTSAMAFNRLIDRRFDAANPRTANRHIPAGILSTSSVAWFAVMSGGLFLASTGIFLLREPPNPWPLRLGLPVLLFVLGYSYTKRFTSLSHFWLGASLMLAPVAAWIAIRGITELQTPIMLGLAVFFWVAGFDILYACQDADFDRNVGLHSVPARLGIAGALRVALACHLVMPGLLFAVTLTTTHLGPIYLVGLGLLTLLLLVQHSLVRPDDLTRVNQAFFGVNAIVSIGLFIVVVLDLLID
ncbi:UbiA-like polyprenyltransferase [Tuwongella immobilis]|uniref:4-hydroxybenzoate polyprenyltransferase n=1 Tax=Tuwongella immobilis TaxID=692036 RepID=A0A6C2YIW0_9BACT|nr:UbiA-like polyprenyltransferase [Tuwongella immobilis]VIP01221.1 4-hydroxybenzoate polyprenyltransferase : 4-hydroxybenzoate octaprenyltransferase OS=Blastopirellula marina DSM 3645 GN=DSM3645_22029 PE=4 SV=1: UbiA [Tuwongella immobilis]VTR97868.1 4-hydroxybenzoate polyprenyltransferase : 4-hydroxybenzoate octaprenyltransferase OS=Blastopirellula marina DSM 3645 GN=DSM3645_22029 PE=4 SV=1: UbiA [Tuwongella immobilis]